MAAPKRTVKQREADFVKLAKLYVRGKTQAEIAAVFGVSRQQISYDLKQLHAQWREDTTLALDDYKQKELAKLDALENEYWQAWERSQESRATKKRKGPVAVSGGEGEAGAQVQEIIIADSCGDSRYLDGIQRCIDRRCKLLGLDAPQKVDASVRRDPLEERSEEEVAEMMKVVLDEFVADKAQTRVVDE